MKKTEKDLLDAGWTKNADDVWVMPGIGAHMSFESAVTLAFGWTERRKLKDAA